jgi:2-iminobutanoate/2-iminopropanoate deaminase
VKFVFEQWGIVQSRQEWSFIFNLKKDEGKKMSKRIIETKSAPAPVGPYSQAVEIGDTLYCSGQIAIDPTTGEVFTGDVKAQTERVMKNIDAVLAAASLNFSNVVKTTIYLINMGDFAQVNEVYGRYFKSSPPARSTVAVSGLPKGVSVEIEVLAKRS